MPDTSLQAINPRQLLKRLLDRCKKCEAYFNENAGVLREEGSMFTEEQVVAIFVDIHTRHQEHDDDLS